MPFANNAIIEVWVESEKVGSQWQFHDGSPIPQICPIEMTNESTEVRLRARGSTSLACWDCPETNMYHYSCEYLRLLDISN